MKTKDFSFELPSELVAQKPVHTRGMSRLMVLDRASGRIVDSSVDRLADYVVPGTLVVLNDSRVRKAMIRGVAEDAGRPYSFLLIQEIRPRVWTAMVKRARRLRMGRRFVFPGGLCATVVGDESGFKLLQFDAVVDNAYFEQHGEVPLPPYIKRKADREDGERYQTVYAREYGSVAAPTAGLHLTSEILDGLKRKGADLAFVTLHVGPGTFLPVSTDNVEDFRLHSEYVQVSADTADMVQKAVDAGNDILAVGTTVVRVLESMWENGRMRSGSRRTEIFIYPGYDFRVVTKLLTNFHTPGSTLVLLAAAFAGSEHLLTAYRQAIALGFRFYSYGDAMLIG